MGMLKEKNHQIKPATSQQTVAYSPTTDQRMTKNDMHIHEYFDRMYSWITTEQTSDSEQSKNSLQQGWPLVTSHHLAENK